MNYSEAMNYIESVSKRGSVLGLDTTRELLRRVGNPQDELSFIHIAGTNGKGSALAFISEILMEADYRVGRYISPIIYCYQEKIQVNHEYISAEAIAKHITVLKEACDAMVLEGLEQPTVFEIETAMAFLHFAEEKCDLVVLETGMGGRDDSTNVIRSPLVSVLMSISLDHVGMIGNNLEEIATCKAGIIKENSDTVLYAQSDEVMNIVRAVCEQKHNNLTISRPDRIVCKENSLYGQVFDYDDLQDIRMTLLGEHQMKNAAVAVEVVKVLNKKGYTIRDEAVLRGIANTRWPGRFEIVNSRPLIIMDGAHNPDGAMTFRKSVLQYLQGYTVIMIMGVLKDKDYPEIVRLTNDLASVIITVNPDNARALSDVELKNTIDQYKVRDIPVLAAGRIESAIELASQIAMQLQQDNTAIVVFGSLSFLGDLGRYLS